ncbi:hypothetical protein C8Q74DRAFT_1312527 [Fomes fomentarius]|nr:hypothetical protein C8Q74DRAFT_1312527 [Fomes fomentarius]
MEHPASSTPPAADGGYSSTRWSDNISTEQRESIINYAKFILRGPGEFAKPVGSRLELTEVSAYERAEDGRLHADVVFEIDTALDMTNSGRNVHGGCTMFMIDVCSSIALVALSIAMKKPVYFVSQALTTVFHSPATVDSRLRIVNKTTAFGARTVSARTEIWDLTNRRLVATGIHNQMQPSQPKL